MQKKSRYLWEKIFQARQGFRFDPAFYFLPSAFHVNKAGPSKFLNMVRNSGSRDSEVLAQIAHASASLRVAEIINRGVNPGLTTREETHKYSEPVRIGQRLEHLGELIYIFIKTLRHNSKYKPQPAFVK